MVTEGLLAMLKDFFESESMDSGGITAEYVYRLWGGNISVEDIENGFRELRTKEYFYIRVNG